MISKKLTIIISVVVFLLSGVGSYFYFGQQLVKFGSLADYKGTVPGDTSLLPEDSGPKTEPCPMNGALYSKAQRKIWEGRRPLGVMIENHTDSRPQSGLSFADIMYEAVAEGGITRFMAIYYCRDANPIGPVRSARMYYVQLLQEYGKNPLYAHVGGANTPGPADALGEIRDLGWDIYNDLNQFGVPFPYYYRDYERLPNVATEHTMYAATSKLWEFAKSKRKLSNVDEDREKWDETFSPWNFIDDATVQQRGSTNKISLGFWDQYNDFDVQWNYDKQSNAYKRVNGGAPHLDKNTGKQLYAKNVVVVLSDESVANDGYDAGQHLLYDLSGSGDGFLFQNGKAVKITWRKNKPESRMKFYDPSGEEASFVRGPIWVQIVPLGNKIAY